MPDQPRKINDISINTFFEIYPYISINTKTNVPFYYKNVNKTEVDIFIINIVTYSLK